MMLSEVVSPVCYASILTIPNGTIVNTGKIEITADTHRMALKPKNGGK
jgi:hypothetical protein